MIRHMRYMFAVGGDSWLLEPLDLFQEHSNVKPCKQEGRRQASSHGQLESRTVVKSQLNLNKDEQEARDQSDSPLSRKRPLSAAESNAEYETFQTALVASTELVDKIITNPDPRGTLAGIDLEIADVSRVYHRDTNATQKLYETSFAIIAGLKSGDEIDFPDVPYPPQQFPEKRPQSQGAKGRNQARMQAEAASRNMLALAMERQVADIVPDHSMLAADLSKAGNDKSRILEELVGVLDDGDCKIAPDGFGYIAGADNNNRKVFHLFSNDDNGADDSEVARFLGGNEAIVVRLVDAMKDFHVGPPRKRPGSTEYKNTLKEFARNTIYDWKRRGYLCKGTRLLVIAIDANETMTVLRTIQRSKRDKARRNDVQLRNAIHAKDPETPMEKFGSVRLLKGSAKDSFMQVYSKQMIYEMQEKNEDESWDPASIFGDCAVAFMGGGGSQEYVSVVNYSGDDILLSQGQSYSDDAVKEAIRHSINQGEGEKMIFSAIYGIVKMVGSGMKDYAMTTTFDVRCEDNDALAGPSMPLILSLKQALQHEGCQFAGRILLQGHKKTAAAVVYKLGLAQPARSGGSSNRLRVNKTCKSALFYVDLVALFHTLEQHERFPQLEEGQRALSILAIYTFISTDYITTNGISYSHAYDGLLSPQFKNYVEAQGARAGRLIHHESHTTFEDVDLELVTTPCFAEGMWFLFQAMIMSKPRTKKVLSERYSTGALDNALSEATIDYNTIRLATLMARNTPAPDIPSYLAHASAANVMVQQWSLGILVKRPAHGSHELHGSSYVLPTKTGDCIAIDFNVQLGDRKTQKKLKQQDRAAHWIDHFEKQYGKGSVSQQEAIFLQPLKDAFHYNGFPKPVSVPFSNVQIDGHARSRDELAEKLQAASGAPVTTWKIFEHTICGCTTFNVKGNGKPLLVNKSTTPKLASTGTPYRPSEVAWEPLEQWPVSETVVQMPLEEIFKAIDPKKQITGVSHLEAITVLTTLAEYVLDKFSSESLPVEDDDEEEEEDDDDLVQTAEQLLDDDMDISDSS